MSFSATPAESIVIGLLIRVGADKCLTQLFFLIFLCLQHYYLSKFANLVGRCRILLSNYAI
jgi:hypothetical protein